MSLELYHFWDSVCSFKVRFCLAEKQLAWADRHIDLLAFDHLKPDYLKINSAGLVPALVHIGRAIVESTVINEYLDEVFPEIALRPADPAARADMRVWVKYEDDVLHPAVRPGTFNLMLKSVVASKSDAEINAMVAAHPKPEVAKDWVRAASGPVDRGAVDEASAKLNSALGRMDQRLSKNQWLAGNTFSLADIALAPMIDRVEYLALSSLWADKPYLVHWFERIKTRSGFKTASPAHRMSGPVC